MELDVFRTVVSRKSDLQIHNGKQGRDDGDWRAAGVGFNVTTPKATRLLGSMTSEIAMVRIKRVTRMTGQESRPGCTS